MLMRFFGLASVVGIIGIAGAAGAFTLRGGAAAATETSSGNVALRQEGRIKSAAPKAPRLLAPTPVKSAAVETPDSIPSPPPAVAAKPAVTGTSGALVGEGRTSLTDSVYAVRTGDAIVVNFDVQGSRTHRADKFEQMVRLTLPLVYGRRNTSALDSIPTGSLLPSRDVVGELATQGLHLTLGNGTRISLWPQTRESSSGPLVVAYRVVVDR